MEHEIVPKFWPISRAVTRIVLGTSEKIRHNSVFYLIRFEYDDRFSLDTSESLTSETGVYRMETLRSLWE